MSVPQVLQDLDLDIGSTEAYLEAVLANPGNGDYTYSVLFEGDYADWSGKVNVPGSKVSKKLKGDFTKSFKEVKELDKDIQKPEKDLEELLGEKKNYGGEVETTVDEYVKLKRRKKVEATFGTRIVRKAKPSRYALDLSVMVGETQCVGTVLVPEKDELLQKLIEEAKKTAALGHH